MDEEIEALASRRTWELVTSTDTAFVGCCSVFTLKYHPDASVDKYKAKIVVKSTQIYDINNFETFLLVARMNSIRILFSIIVNLSWSLFQLDVKNTFFYGDLQKSTTRYFTFIGEILVTWRNKKHDVVSRSSAEPEYRAMDHTACRWCG